MNSNPLSCYSLNENPEHLKASYKRLVLIAHRRHLDDFDENDDSTLFAASNWLLWQVCLNEGRHCVHVDRGILDWSEAYDLGNDLYIRANDWMFIDDVDITCFHDVSLGSKFNSELTLLLTDLEKQSRALTTLVQSYDIKEIVFFDFLTDYGFLDIPGRFKVVEGVAKSLDIKAVDRRDPLANGEPGMAHIDQAPVTANQTRAAGKEISISEIANTAFRKIMTSIGLLQRYFSPRKKSILIATTQLNGLPLINSFTDNASLRPLYLAAWAPHKLRLARIFQYLLKGISFVDAVTPTLSSMDIAAVDKIKDVVARRFKTNPVPHNEEVERYVTRHLLGTKVFEEAARTVKWGERLLDEQKPDVIFTDGFRNPLTTTLLELGKKREITTIATWHAQLAQYVKLHALGCDPRVPSSIDKCFAWGAALDDWLERIEAKTTSVKTGSLISGKKRKPPLQPQSKNGKTALVLQYFLNYSDYRAPAAYEYDYYVNIVRILADLGIGNIIFKLHPGAPKEPYYEKIAQAFGLKCTIVRTNPLSTYIDVADFAIGQPASGSMLEVLSADVPFYPVLLPPNSTSHLFAEKGTVFTDYSTLREAISTGYVPDMRDVYDAYTSNKEIPDPARQVWNAFLDVPVIWAPKGYRNI